MAGAAVATLLVGRDRIDSSTRAHRSLAGRHSRNALIASLALALPLLWALDQFGAPVPLASALVAAAVMAVWVITAQRLIGGSQHS